MNVVGRMGIFKALYATGAVLVLLVLAPHSLEPAGNVTRLYAFLSAPFLLYFLYRLIFVPQTVDSFLKALYGACSALLLMAIAFNTVFSTADARGGYGFLATAVVLCFSYYLVFVRAEPEGLVDTLSPVLFFNLVIVVLFYYAGFEFGFKRNDFKVGFTYSNFWDFYYQALTAAEGTFEAVNTGYFPFSYALSKFFAVLAGWRPGFHNIRSGTVLIYFIFLMVFLSPLVLLAREIVVSKRFRGETVFFLGLFLAICYPVLFAVERGNFAIISFFFLSLMLYFYNRGKLGWCAVCAGFLVSLKVVNLLFVVFVLRYCFRQLGLFLGVVVSVTVGSLIALFGFNFDKWAVFKYALVAPFGHMVPDVVQQIFVATDGGKLQGGAAGIEAFRVLLRTLIYSVNANLTSDIATWNLFLLAAGFVFFVYFYARCRKTADWLDEVMVLTTIPLLFHSASAEYNLLLLMPALMLIASRETSLYNNMLLRFSGLFLMLSGGIVIALVRVDSGQFNSVTPKSFLVPFSLMGLLLTIYIRKDLDRPGPSSEHAGEAISLEPSKDHALE